MKKGFVFLLSCGALSLLAASCANDSPSRERTSAQPIGISVFSEQPEQTKSTGGEAVLFDSFVLDEDGEDVFTVNAFVSDFNSLPFVCEESTKGSVVTTSSLNSDGQKFTLNAWLGSENRDEAIIPGTGDADNYHFIDNSLVSFSDGVWSTDNNYVWRSAVPTTFWSSYPVELTGGAVRAITWPSDTAGDEDQAKMSFVYSLGEAASAQDLEDILFAYNCQSVTLENDPVSGHPTGTDGSTTVKIHFKHPLAAIRFDVSGLVRKGLVIKAITLDGVAASAGCEASGTVDGIDFDWNIGSDKTVVRQEFDASDFTEYSIGENPIPSTLQGFSNDKIFFLIPQAVKDSGIKAVIEYSHSGGDGTVLTKTLLLDHEEAWSSGMYYTYCISMSGVDLLVEDKVIENVKKDLAIKNIGADTAYIRAMIAGNWVNANGEIIAEWDPEDASVGTFEGTDYTGWIKGSDGFYYHKDPVPAGTAASTLFESYTVTNRPSILEDSDYLEFAVVAQSVLADTGKASAMAAWGSTAAGYLN